MSEWVTSLGALHVKSLGEELVAFDHWNMSVCGTFPPGKLSLLRAPSQGDFRLRWLAMRFQPFADELSEALASDLRDRRIARGLSMNELATKTGLAVSFIGYIERAERRPSVETLVKLSWALGVSAAEILERVERPIFLRQSAAEKKIK